MQRIISFIIGLCLFFFFYRAFSAFVDDEENYRWNVFGQLTSTTAQIVSKGFELTFGFHFNYITQLNNRNKIIILSARVCQFAEFYSLLSLKYLMEFYNKTKNKY